MSEYINKEEVISIVLAFRAVYDPWYNTDDIIEFIAKEIDEMPTADVQEIKWIPVSERLPIYNTEWVLTYRPTMGVKMLVDRYEGHYGEDDDDDEWEEGWIYGGDTVAAWMPLPRPYEAT